MAPAKFGDIGKPGNSLLNDDYKYESKCEVKTKLENGVVRILSEEGRRFCRTAKWVAGGTAGIIGDLPSPSPHACAARELPGGILQLP